MDPVQSANRWYQWHVRGSAEVLEQVLSSLEANLPPGWRRLTGAELEAYPSNEKPGSRWYLLESSSPDFLGAGVSIYPRSSTELRGGRASFILAPGAQTGPGWEPNWAPMMQFLDEGVVVAARRVGAAVHAPTFDEMFLSDLGVGLASRLKEFSRPASKTLPLNQEDAERWRGFVVDAYRTRRPIDTAQLVGWLVHDGWKRQDATELTQRFFDECLLLEKYVEEVFAA
jgi:hypothetical protein